MSFTKSAVCAPKMPSQKERPHQLMHFISSKHTIACSNLLHCTKYYISIESIWVGQITQLNSGGKNKKSLCVLYKTWDSARENKIYTSPFPHTETRYALFPPSYCLFQGCPTISPVEVMISSNSFQFEWAPQSAMGLGPQRITYIKQNGMSVI